MYDVCMRLTLKSLTMFMVPLYHTQDGKDARHFAASLTYHDIVAVIDKHRFSVVRHIPDLSCHWLIAWC